MHSIKAFALLCGDRNSEFLEVRAVVEDLLQITNNILL